MKTISKMTSKSKVMLLDNCIAQLEAAQNVEIQLLKERQENIDKVLLDLQKFLQVLRRKET
jgi:hypothetical protein